MNWMVPLSRLGEQQLAILSECRRATKNGWLRGVAGSGKSVLLVHLLQEHLANNPGATVCGVVYTHALRDLVGTGIADTNKSRTPVYTYFQFLRLNKPHDYVVVDEVQDIPPGELQRIRNLARRLIVAGDTDQQLYDHGGTEDQIRNELQPQEHKLTVLYRLTQRVAEIARAILPNSNIETARYSRMAEVDVSLYSASDESSEFRWVWAKASTFAQAGTPVVVILPTHERVKAFAATVANILGFELGKIPWMKGKPDYSVLNDLMMSKGCPLRYLGNSYGGLGESDAKPIVYVMTYHSAKGLDFETVLLPGLNPDAFSKFDGARAEKLFFVGLTRCRKNLFLSFSEEDPHEFLTRIPAQLLRRVSPENERASAGSTDEILF